MNTYEIPDEPDVRDLWGPTNDGEGWNHYEKFVPYGHVDAVWRVVGDSGKGLFTWLELIARGPLHDENPDPPLEVLRDRVVEAAVAWEAEFDKTTRAHLLRGNELRDAVYDYNVKKGSK